MQSPDLLPPLVVLLGPTGVGKSDLAIQLAERINGEIISADSRLFYRRMDIGTAKPTPEQRALIPHHLIDVSNPNETWSLVKFKEVAAEIISEVHKRERVPILVGGTGQYIRAVVEAWEIPTQPPDFKLRTALENWVEDIGADGLHKRLALLDPEAAELIDHRNLKRTIRALEVILYTGQSFSSQRRQGSSPYRILQIGINRTRDELYRQIDERIQKMLEDGFVDEVSALLAAGYSPELPSFSAIGYKQIADFLAGNLSLEEAIIEIKRKTRQLVRRQANWFKLNDPTIQWFDAASVELEELEDLVIKFLQNGGKLA
ncbi:MAG: tRNA (adenosine(37)-N6)-dimethylallyltransferase MiaA [Chloroflexi bacterium]|nr:tRNA (adenosine(37)-N6)-dimethylallyltransferase MiaA [Chloroflexota bacterium]